MDIKKGFATAAFLLASLAGVQAEGQTVYAYVAETIPANSDVLVSVPVNNNVEVELTTSSVSGSVITVPNSPDFAAGDYDAAAFAKYYVRFVDGPAAGLWSSVTANSETGITIDDAVVAALATPGGGDTIRVYAHHTLGSVFSSELLDIAFEEGTQILTFSDADSQNKSAGSGSVNTYTEFLGIGWGTNAARPLNPEEAFIIRNAGSNTLTYIAVGEAPDHPVSYLVDGGADKDTPLGTGYPVPVTVDETGLGGVEGRQVLLQGTTGLNPAPGSAAVYTFTTFLGIGWGANGTVALPANSAFIFRQGSADAGGVSTATKPY